MKKAMEDGMELEKTEEEVMVDVHNMEKDKSMMDSIIHLHHVTTEKPHQVKSIVWCDKINRFTKKTSPNHISLKLEIETLHNIDMDIVGNTAQSANLGSYGKI